MRFTDSIPHLNIEVLDNGNIRLENESMGDCYAVDIHPMHLRHMAEKMGLVETSDPQAQKTIAMLTRRLLVLRDRIDLLHNYLLNHSDHKHADLSYELTYATATTDLAEEFCAELDEVQASTESPEQASKSVKASTGTGTRQMTIDA